MDPDFWHDRWRKGRIGFHQERVSPLLEQYWPAVGAAEDARVFVPLCGKSIDMAWLAARGHGVLGVELSQTAVEQFFAGHGLIPEVHTTRYGLHHVAGRIEIIVGDAFALDATALTDCAAVFDRAALIALPPEMRRPYLVDLYARLPTGCRGLVVTLEYPQAQTSGPPFSVEETEVRTGLAEAWRIDLLERRDVLAREPGFAADGVTALSTCAWRIQRDG